MKLRKSEVKQLSYDIADYLCNIIGFEHPSDINVSVIDSDQDDNGSRVVRSPGYMISHIILNIKDAKDIDTMVGIICHELAHVFLTEYYEFFETWVDEEQDTNSPQFKTFKRAEERSAMRFGRFLHHIWDNRPIDGAIDEQGNN